MHITGRYLVDRSSLHNFRRSTPRKRQLRSADLTSWVICECVRLAKMILGNFGISFSLSFLPAFFFGAACFPCFEFAVAALASRGSAPSASASSRASGSGTPRKFLQTGTTRQIYRFG